MCRLTCSHFHIGSRPRSVFSFHLIHGHAHWCLIVVFFLVPFYFLLNFTFLLFLILWSRMPDTETDLWCGSRCIRRRYKSLSDCVCLIVRQSLQPLDLSGVGVLSSGAHRMPHPGAPIASAETDGAWSDNLAAASAYRR